MRSEVWRRQHFELIAGLISSIGLVGVRDELVENAVGALRGASQFFDEHKFRVSCGQRLIKEEVFVGALSENLPCTNVVDGGDGVNGKCGSCRNCLVVESVLECLFVRKWTVKK